MQFPENKKAKSLSIEQQARKITEEANEVFLAAIDGESDERILEECFDVIQAVEGILRRYDRETINRVHDAVRDKCRARGDYD